MSKFDKIIIGTEQLGGADWGKYNISHTESAIKYGLDIGVRSFDTAHVYGLGLSEKRLSKLMGGLRHECEIITKIGLTPRIVVIVLKRMHATLNNGELMLIRIFRCRGKSRHLLLLK